MATGILTIAIGASKYIDQAEMLIRSLRVNMPHLPIAVVTDSKRLLNVADYCIAVDRTISISTEQKLMLDEYSPFTETLFIDSDCIVTRPFDEELDEIRKFDFTPIFERWIAPPSKDEYIKDMETALRMVGGKSFAKFNGGVYYFREGGAASKILKLAREYHKQAETLGIIPFDKGGAGDETVISLAMSHYHVDQLYDDRGNLMRTPLGISGPLRIDPLGKGSEFIKRGALVRPAICHFAGHFISRPEYIMSCWALRSGTSVANLSIYLKILSYLISWRQNLSRHIGYKIHGLKKRMFKSSNPEHGRS